LIDYNGSSEKSLIQKKGEILMLEIRHENMGKTKATQEAYNRIFRDKGILHKDSFYLWLIRLLTPLKGKLLIDISCGQGRLVTLAQKLGLQTIGVDFAFDGVQIGRNETPQSGWIVGDGERLPLADRCADYVTHIGSLEHYIDPASGVKEIARILKSNGKACILLPNSFGLLGNIIFVLKTGDIFDDGQPLQRYGTRTAWENLLSDGGLMVEKVINYGEVDFPHTMRDAIELIRKPHKVIRYFFNRLVPINWANQFVFLCRRVLEEKNNEKRSFEV
jgi:SAM-dependent methyltransferase